MTLRHWLAALGMGRIEIRRSTRAGRLRRRRSAFGNAPACFERLEDRTLPTVYVVNGFADTIDARDGVVSLREAITAANTNAASGNAAAGSVDGDMITFSLNTLQRLQLNGALGQYEITDDLVIDGSSNPTRIALSGEQGARVFRVNAGAGPGSEHRVEFRSFNIVAGTGSGAGGNGGGAIVVQSGSDLTLRDVSISGSTTNRGGGILNEGTLSLILSTVAGCTAGTGGGIYNTGTLSLFASQILQNSTSGGSLGGGGIANDGGDVTISGNSLIENNRSIAGGGIFTIGGRVRMSGGAILHNSARFSGGGVEAAATDLFDVQHQNLPSVPYDVRLVGVNLGYNIAGPNVSGAVVPGDGGGLHARGPGMVIVNGGTVVGNLASREGGGLWNSARATMIVTGATLFGNMASRGFDDGITVNAGGGIFNSGGTLTASNVRIDSNQAASFGARQGRGGGIASEGVARLTSAVVIRNIAGLGGAIYNAAPASLPTSSFDVVNGQFELNIARESGAVIASAGRLTVTRSSMFQNAALGDLEGQGGGGIFNDSGAAEVRATLIRGCVAQGVAGSGGAILNGVNGRLAVIDSTIDSNRATRAGGGIEDYAGAAADPGNTLFVAGVFLRSNAAGIGLPVPANPGDGGAIHGTGAGEITLFRDVITNNQAANDGGAVWLDDAGTLRVDQTTLSGNQSSGDGAGLFLRGSAVIRTSLVALGTAGGDGGGIWANNSLQLVNSTVGENRAAGSGGGVFVNGDAATTTPVVIGNATIARNRADSDGAGGGTGGGIFVAAAEDVTLHNTVVALNLVGADPAPGRSDFVGIANPVSSFNFIGDGTGSNFVNGVNANQVGSAAAPIDPQLSSLGNFGGPTRLYQPTSLSSPLVDQGKDVLLTGVDQRLSHRPFSWAIARPPGGDGSDIGAFEARFEA